MTIKQQGGVFGRNPSFNDVEINDLDANIGLFNSLGVNVTGTLARPAEFNTTVRIADGSSIEWGGITANIAGSSSSNTLFFSTNGEAGRFDSSKNLDLTYGGGNVMLASGAGIDFSATSGTGTSELFDDYEEGTWTPVLSDGTNDATMSANSAGSYTKIGRLIVLNASVETTSLGSVTGAIRITGLPYSNLTGTAFYASSAVGYGELLNITAGQSVGVAVNSGNAHINLNLWDAAGGISPMQASEWSADGVITFSISYFGA